MSRKVSIAAICVGVLCTALCASAYVSEKRPGNDPPDQMFWELAAAGVTLLGLGVRGWLGQLDRKNIRTSDEAKPAEEPGPCQWAKCDRPAVIHLTEVNSDTGAVKCLRLREEHAREHCEKQPRNTTWR
jgi:hypothetical protein